MAATEQTRKRVERHTAAADDALAALHRARTDEVRLAAAKKLESAACQLRRALKEATA
jgi:hypothetical protein